MSLNPLAARQLFVEVNLAEPCDRGAQFPGESYILSVGVGSNCSSFRMPQHSPPPPRGAEGEEEAEGVCNVCSLELECFDCNTNRDT